jgi:hypothetical protein
MFARLQELWRTTDQQIETHGRNFDSGGTIGHSRALNIKAVHEYALFNLSRD